MFKRCITLLIVFCSLLLFLSSCSVEKDKTPNVPPVEKIDRKTYSTKSDVWKVDPSATCGDEIIDPNPNMTYGIDLHENFYWEVTTTNEGSNIICNSRHLYMIDVTGFESNLSHSNSYISATTSSIPTFKETGILVPQLYRRKCINSEDNTVVSDTGDQADTAIEQRILHVVAMKGTLILIFEKSPLCPDKKLVLQLKRQKLSLL